jgi:hypothetical protein
MPAGWANYIPALGNDPQRKAVEEYYQRLQNIRKPNTRTQQEAVANYLNKLSEATKDKNN